MPKRNLWIKAFLVASFFWGVASTKAANVEIKQKEAKEIFQLRQDIFDYLKFWKSDSPYSQFIHKGPGKIPEIRILAEQFADMTAMHTLAILRQDKSYNYRPEKFRLLCFVDDYNLIDAGCFEDSFNLEDLFKSFAQSLQVSKADIAYASSSNAPSNMVKSLWEQKRRLSEIKFEHAMASLGPWLKGADPEKSFLEKLRGFDPIDDAKIGNAEIGYIDYIDLCEGNVGTGGGCELSPSKLEDKIEDICKVDLKKKFDEELSTECQQYMVIINDHLSKHLLEEYQQFYYELFEFAYLESRSSYNNDLTKTIQLAEIVSGLPYYARDWLGLDTQQYQKTSEQLKGLTYDVGIFLRKEEESFKGVNVTDPLDKNTRRSACENLKLPVPDDSQLTFLGFKADEDLADCSALFKEDIALSLEKLELSKRSSVLVWARYQAARELLAGSTKHLERRFRGISLDWDGSGIFPSEIDSFISAVTRVSYGAESAIRLYATTDNSVLCNSEPLDTNDPDPPLCDFKKNKPLSFLEMDVSTFPIDQIRSESGNYSIEDAPAKIEYADKAFSVSKSTGLKLAFKVPDINSNQNTIRTSSIYDFGPRAILNATIIADVGCTESFAHGQSMLNLVERLKQIGGCASKPTVNIDWPNAPTKPIWNGRVNRKTVEQFLQQLNLPPGIEVSMSALKFKAQRGKGQSFILELAIKPKGLKVSTAVNIQLDLSNGSLDEWSKSVTRAAKQAILVSINDTNALIAQGKSLSWLNIPDDLQIQAIALKDHQPLVFVAIAHPKKEPALLSSYELYGSKSTRSGTPSLVWGEGKLLIPPQLAVLLSKQDYSNLTSQLPEPSKLLNALLRSDKIKSHSDALVVYLNQLQPIYSTMLNTQISQEEKRKRMERLLVDARILTESKADLYHRLEEVLKEVWQGVRDSPLPYFHADIHVQVKTALTSSAPQYVLNAELKLPVENVLGNTLFHKQTQVTSIISHEFKIALANEAQKGGLTPCIVEKESLSKCPLPASVLTKVNAKLNKSLFVIHKEKEQLYENPGSGLLREDIDKALNSLREQTANYVKDKLEGLWEKAVAAVVDHSNLVLNEQIKTELEKGLENLSCDDTRQKAICEFVLSDLSLRLWGLADSSFEHVRIDIVKSDPLLRQLFFEFSKNPRLEEVVTRLVQTKLNLCFIDTTREDCVAWRGEVDQLEKKWVDDLLSASNRFNTAVAKPMEQFRKSVEVAAVEVETIVRANLPLSEVKGKLYFSRDIETLGIVAGDQLTGINCDNQKEQWHCAIEPKIASEVAKNLKSINNDVIEVSRGSKKRLLSLGSEMVYIAQLAPIVDGVRRLPDQYREKVDLLSQQAASKLKEVQGTTQKLADIKRQIDNITKEKTKDALGSVLAPFTKECKKHFASISNNCDSPSSFLEDISRTNVVGYVRQHIQRVLARSTPETIDSLRNVDYQASCIEQTGDIANTFLSNALNAMCAKFESETLGVINSILDIDDAKKKARLLPQKVLQAFGVSLATQLNNQAFILAYELAYSEELNQLHALKTSIETRQFGVCLTLSPSQKLVPVEKPERCAPPGKYFQDLSKFQAHIRGQLDQTVASSLEQLYESSKENLRTLCVRTGKSLGSNALNSEEYCGDLDEILQNPQQVVETLKDTAEKVAQDQLENIALSYLETMGVSKEGAQYCVDLNLYGFSKICNRKPQDLLKSIEKLGKSALESIGENFEQRVIDDVVQPVTAEMELVAANFCSKVNKLFLSEFDLLGGKAKFASNASCPSDNLDLVLDLFVDSFSPKNQRIKITAGVKLDEKRFQKALDEGKPAQALSLNWQQIEFSPSLETIINEELAYDNGFIILDRITPTKSGINVAATMQPSKYSFVVPVNMIVDKAGFQIKVSDFSDVLVQNLCLEAKNYFKRKRPVIFDGAVIVDSPTAYCNERGFKGLELSVQVDFSNPLNQQQLQAFVDIERGLKIEMPDSKSLVASAALEALGVNFLTPVPPFYNYDDGLSLFFDGTIETPLNLNLEFGFQVSPRKMAYRGPIGITIPGWYDTNAVSLGNLGLQFQPEQKLITFRGSVTTPPGEVTHKLIRIDGSATLGVKDFMIILRGSVKVLSVLDLMTSTTTIAFKERLFETKVNSSPLLSDLLAINGLLRVQDKKPHPYFKVEGKGELFGAEIAKADVLLKRDFSGHFSAKLEVPVTKQGGQFAVRAEKKLSNLSAKGNFVAHLSPFKFDLSVEANSNFVETGISFKPPKMELSVKLPSLKSLTAEYLLSLILDLKLKFELTNKLDFTSVPENKGGGVKDSSFKNSPTGAKTDKKQAEQVTLNRAHPKALGLSGTWYNKAVTHSKGIWFGFKWGTDYWTEWVPTFNNARIAGMASDIGLDAKDMKTGNYYYAEQGHYEFLIGATGVANKKIHVFLKDQSLIWSGKYQGPVTEITRKIITHKLKPNQSILVTRDLNGIVYVGVQQDLIDTTAAKHKIEGSAFLGENEFATRLLGDLAAELAWHRRVHEIEEIGDKNAWSLLKTIKENGSPLYSLVHFYKKRNPQLISYQVKTAGDSFTPLASIKKAIQSNYIELGTKFEDACSGKDTDVTNPCGYMVTADDWLFAIEASADLNLKYKHVYWASGGKAYESKLYVSSTMMTDGLMSETGKPLENSLRNIFSKFNEITDVGNAFVNFGTPIRMALLVKKSDVEHILFVAEDTLKRGDADPYKANMKSFSCLEQYLSKSNHGKAFSPSPEQLKKLGIDKKRAWMEGLAWPDRFIELGFKSNPINSIYANCGG
jgi:hypothetical protein